MNILNSLPILYGPLGSSLLWAMVAAAFFVLIAAICLIRLELGFSGSSKLAGPTIILVIGTMVMAFVARDATPSTEIKTIANRSVVYDSAKNAFRLIGSDVYVYADGRMMNDTTEVDVSPYEVRYLFNHFKKREGIVPEVHNPSSLKGIAYTTPTVAHEPAKD